MVKYILFGAIIGGVIGSIINLTTLTGVILGAIIGSFSYLIRAKRNTFPRTDKKAEQNLQLREEQLEIKKERVQTGEVKIHKEIVEGKKTITVQVRREEMVIEAGDEEEFRIPLKEEKIEITKHPVKIADVSISKRQIEEIEQVKTTLKKETARVEVEGEVDISKEDTKL
ncbi:YsnF/AvaK domain-containing protein [Anaerobacillus isosaccharinicus]|uniref:YsnF/AvaK domain-containing protein n=1 Tax=Anaerobacillus isosaccharinicus TaxID=1532552 RepID=A0A1S2MF08_9BACI|nr:YsnF/AvaK domain-containing protein [Anaerobacillus isosaccharinicus]MBA5584022.1 YsnF/AvaK domain-containing protein [Anaerobacillus isosaccharinicus]QOY37563.1 YsnF/AvaK domain-containing protein [Anaerobacillus isosaccharinicus]